MKRVGGIITVLLVVFCLGTVISCAGTKDAVIKDSKKGNALRLSGKKALSLSEPILESQLNSDSGFDAAATDGLTQEADLPAQAFLAEDLFAGEMLSIPNELQIEEIALFEEPDEQLSVAPEDTAVVLDDNASKGSVLFTLKRAEEIKSGKLSSIGGLTNEAEESTPNKIVESTPEAARPTLSVLQERLLGYKKLTAKVESYAVISESPLENYGSELVVLPVISVMPIKPEVMIQEKAYLAQVISLPEIAEEVAGDTTEVVVDENAVQTAESVSLPKTLEISLGNSVNAFGLPESFISPYAVADVHNEAATSAADDTDKYAVARAEALPQVEVQHEILPPDTPVPEVVFAAKNQDEQNAALKEILSANKIETSVVVKENAIEHKTVAVAYPQAHEVEELEEATDFEMKPDFLYPDEKISGQENQETIIRMQGAGWRIDATNSYPLKLIDRRNDKNGSTTFRIKNGNAGTERITFTRYNEAENRQETQVYFVDVKPALLNGENSKKAAPKVEKAEKSKANGDYRRTLADHLYADENYAQASVYYKKLIDENISDNELLYKAAHSMKEIGSIDTAAEYYQRNLAEEGNPFYDDAIIEYIQLLKERKEFDKAINEVYERGLSKSVSENCTQKLYGILGDLFFNVKNYTEAVRTYKTVLSLYPSGSGEDKAMFYLAYALELQENPEFKEAQRFYRELLDVYPESQYVNLSRSRIGFIDRHYTKVN